MQSGAVVMTAGEAIPVVGVRVAALFAMKIGVDGHRFGGFELVDEIVGAGPVAVGIPPERFYGYGQTRGWGGRVQRGFEGLEIHRCYRNSKERSASSNRSTAVRYGIICGIATQTFVVVY